MTRLHRPPEGTDGGGSPPILRAKPEPLPPPLKIKGTDHESLDSPGQMIK